MTLSRTAIPAALERDLMIEAGYRCAVCQSTSPLEIDHIEDWAKGAGARLRQHDCLVCQLSRPQAEFERPASHQSRQPPSHQVEFDALEWPIL